MVPREAAPGAPGLEAVVREAVAAAISGGGALDFDGFGVRTDEAWTVLGGEPRLCLVGAVIAHRAVGTRYWNAYHCAELATGFRAVVWRALDDGFAGLKPDDSYRGDRKREISPDPEALAAHALGARLRGEELERRRRVAEEEAEALRAREEKTQR